MPTRHDVGNGQVLEALGMERGNAFLDIIGNVPDFRHVKPLLDLGTLNIRSPLVAGALAQFVAQGALTQAEAAKLLAIGQEANGPEQAAITISLPTGHACQHDASLLVVAGGMFAADALVEVAAPGGAAVAFPAQFILTGQN